MSTHSEEENLGRSFEFSKEPSSYMLKTDVEQRITEIKEYYEEQLVTMQDEVKQLKAALSVKKNKNQALVAREKLQHNTYAQAEEQIEELSTEVGRLRKKLEKIQTAKRKSLGMYLHLSPPE